MHTIVIISTTVERKTDAENLLEILFEQKLIGCAHIVGPVQSYYRWEKKMENSSEFILNVKTIEHHAEKVINVIKQIHPYELPEIMGKKLDFASEAYSTWLEGEVI